MEGMLFSQVRRVVWSVPWRLPCERVFPGWWVLTWVERPRMFHIMMVYWSEHLKQRWPAFGCVHRCYRSIRLRLAGAQSCVLMEDAFRWGPTLRVQTLVQPVIEVVDH